MYRKEESSSILPSRKPEISSPLERVSSPDSVHRATMKNSVRHLGASQVTTAATDGFSDTGTSRSAFFVTSMYKDPGMLDASNVQTERAEIMQRNMVKITNNTTCDKGGQSINNYKTIKGINNSISPIDNVPRVKRVNTTLLTNFSDMKDKFAINDAGKQRGSDMPKFVSSSGVQSLVVNTVNVQKCSNGISPVCQPTTGGIYKIYRPLYH